MKRINPHTLTIEEDTDNKKYVYVLSESGCWDYEHTSSVEVFENFESALTAFEQAILDSRTEMYNWLDDDNIEDDKLIDEENSYASYEIYQRGDFSRLHDCLIVEKKEVK